MTASIVHLASIAQLVQLPPPATATQHSSVQSLRVLQMATPILTFSDLPRLESVQKVTLALQEQSHQHHVQLARIMIKLVKLRACPVHQDFSAMNLACQTTLLRYKTRNAMQDTTVLILVLMQPLQLPLAIQFQTHSNVQRVTSVRQDQLHRLFALKAITSQEKVPMSAKNVQLVTTAHSPR